MKFFSALSQTMKKNDSEPLEKLEYNRVRSTIESYCEQYLKDTDDIFEFEALPSALDATLSALESKSFQEKYEFAQTAPTLFVVRLKEFDLLG